jgi:hypothetical protein
VWVVDTKTTIGKFERRADHIAIGGWDRTELVGELRPSIGAVLTALVGIDVPMYAALCFVDAGWSLFLKPFTMGGVWLAPPKRLAAMIAKPGPLSPDQVLEVAARLNGELHPTPF